MPPLGPHPDPPADLAFRTPLFREVPGPFFRFHRTEFDPLYFGRASVHRFDAPEGEFGVLYAAENEFGAFIETFGETDARSITATRLAGYSLSRLHLRRPMRFLDIAETGGLARIGADGRLTTGDHEPAQRWSAAIRQAFHDVDGIAYRCRHDPARIAVAVFDRAADVLCAEVLGQLASPEHERLLASILDVYGFGLID